MADLASWWQLDRPLTPEEQRASGSFADERRRLALDPNTPVQPDVEQQLRG
jgi:hypothetical protein